MAIVAIVGTVITIVLLNRNSDSGQASGPVNSSSSRPAPTSKVTPPSSRRPPSTSARPPGGGGVVIASPIGAYPVPSDWKRNQAQRKSGQEGIVFEGQAEVGTYECGGGQYFRGFTATGEVQGKNGAEINLQSAVTDFGTSFAKEYYAHPALDPRPQTSNTVDGTRVVMQTVKVTVVPTKPDCEATSGEVAIAGVPIEQNGKVVGAKMLVVVIDLAGGPDSPGPLKPEVADQILNGFKPKP